MSIKNPTNADLAHLKEGDDVDVSFIAVPFPVRLQTRLTDHGGALRAGGVDGTVHERHGWPGAVGTALAAASCAGTSTRWAVPKGP